MAFLCLASYCHSDRECSVTGAQASDRRKACPYKMSYRVIQNPAICVAGINLDQAFPHLMMSYDMLHAVLSVVGKEKN